jgi:hypothetical protein
MLAKALFPLLSLMLVVPACDAQQLQTLADAIVRAVAPLLPVEPPIEPPVDPPPVDPPPVDPPPIDPPHEHPPSGNIDFSADVVVVDQYVEVGTLHIMPHQTLIMRPGAEIVIMDMEPMDAAQADTGIHIHGTWRTEGSGDMVIRSANPEGWRGHVMAMPGSYVDIDGIEFRDLGRTRKDIPLSMQDNVPGRYPLHFHRCGPTTQHVVSNCLSVGSSSWAFVNHSSNVIFQDCVAVDSFGAAFVAEVGNSVGGFYGCIADGVDGLPFRGIPIQGGFIGGKLDEISAMQDTGDVARHGHGFWVDAPGVDVENCEVINSRSQPYFDFAGPYPEFDTKSSPTSIYLKYEKLGLRKNNKAHGCGGSELWFVENGENVVEGMICTDCIDEVVTGRLTANVMHKDLVAIGRPGEANLAINLAGPYGINSRILNAHFENWNYALVLPSVGWSFVNGATFVNNGVDIVIDRSASDSIPNTLEFMNLGDPKILMRDYMTYIQNFWDVYTSEQRLYLTVGNQEYVLFWKQQHPDYVLWDSRYPSIVAGKTNQQIFDEFGVAPNGCLAPADAEDFGTYLRAPVSESTLVNLPYRSGVNLQGTFAGNAGVGSQRLQFTFAGEDRVLQANVVRGWQAVRIEYGGKRSSIFINGL